MSNFTTELYGIKVASTNYGYNITDKFENINGKEFLAKLRTLTIGNKNGSHWIRTTLNIDIAGTCRGRSDANTTDLARILIIDGDKHINVNGEEVEGAPDPLTISHILKEHNIAHVLHGSHSHYAGEKGNRCRIILITKAPYNLKQLPSTVEAIVALINTGLANRGMNLLAYAKENNRWSQPWLYPRKPKNSIIETLHIEHLDGLLADVIEPINLPPISHTIPQQIKQNKTSQISVIETFNEQKNLEEALTHYGFKRILPNRWLSPDSSSGVPGITVKDNKFFSHHSDNFNDGYWHDCWDLWRNKENLTERDAIIQASQSLYLPDGRTIDQFNKDLSNKHKSPLALPDPRPEVIKFHPEMLPIAMREFILDVAKRQQSQPDFVAVAAIVGLSGLLGRKILIRPKQHDDWEVTPNQWGAIIGRPSAMKSPSMKAALRPLDKIEAKAAKQHEEDKKNYNEEMRLIDLELDIAKTSAKKALKDNDRDKAREALTVSDCPEPPTRTRLIVNDATIEKLGELLNENPNGLILVRDELSGWLFKLSKEEHQGDRAFYLECFDGNGHFTYDRIGRGTVEIKYCTLSIIGGIQPTKIAKLVCDAMKGIADDGLIQRFQLAIWPDDIGSWKWLDSAPNKIAQDAYYKVFDDINNLQFDTHNDEPTCLRFTSEAQLLYIQWMEEIQAKAREKDIHPAIESHMLKMPQTIAGLALLFEIIDGGRKAVNVEATIRSLEWADYLLSHANRLYSIATNQSIDNARLISGRKNKLPNPFTARDIHRKNWIDLDKIESINDALECLVDYRHLLSKELPTTNAGGRPTISYQWNTTS